MRRESGRKITVIKPLTCEDDPIPAAASGPGGQLGSQREEWSR